MSEHQRNPAESGKAAKPPKRRSRGALRYGALSLLAGCFALSAILRTGDVVAGLPAAMTDGFGNPLPAATGDGPKPKSMTIPETNALIVELRRQKADLSDRQSEMSARETRLSAAERRIERRLADIEAAREKLAETAALVDDAAMRDVVHLAEMYQQMKPQQAGAIFNQMAPEFASGFLAEMRPDAAALILANMDAPKAYAITLLLAGRNVGRDEGG